MKNRVAFALLVGVACVMGASAVKADYQPISKVPVEEAMKKPKETPLMVIRFNQPDVPYEMPLYETMTKAFQVKPSAKFDVVSVSQKSAEQSIQERYDQAAAQNLDKVMTTFSQMGMPANRLNVSNTTESVKSSEVRIYIH